VRKFPRIEKGLTISGVDRFTRRGGTCRLHAIFNEPIAHHLGVSCGIVKHGRSGRFARALLRLADAFGREVGQGRIVIRQKVSQADLAAMTGIARENVNRLLHDWASRSLVTRSAGYYCLEKLGELQREAED
jgi:CRP-like cAMP-binding protein